MKKLILSAVAIVAATGTIYAQSYAPDALKFSQTNFGSTSRFKGMAGAQIGVGGDMSSLGGNPAGLGLFTKSEFSLTPEFNGMTGNASYLNQNTESNSDKLNLNHVGVVLYSPSLRAQGQSTQTGVVSSVFGFGYNRNNDFSANFSYAGINPKNSIADYFSDDANSFGEASTQLASNTLRSMAYEAYLIGYDPATTPKYFPETDINNFQSKSEIRSGSTSEITASGALNISNKVYVGATIGLVNVRYLNDAQYDESGFNVTENTNYTMSFLQNQETKGSGVNGRLGIIFRPVSAFRIGATFQTPTWLLIEDNTSMLITSRLSSGVNAGNYSNAGNEANYNFTYRLKTPSKASIGASYVIGGKALISADLDYIDYAAIKFSTDQGGDPQTIRVENNTVKDFYKSTINYRFGAEYKIDNAFSLRGGYGLNGNPYQVDDTGYFETQYYTGGLGYRFDNYYFDVAYQRMETNTDLSPYLLGTADNPQEPVANIKTARNNVFLTFGVRF